jgi:hypothetical protein
MIPSIDRGIARLIVDALVLAMSAICSGADEKFRVNE